MQKCFDLWKVAWINTTSNLNKKYNNNDKSQLLLFFLPIRLNGDIVTTSTPQSHAAPEDVMVTIAGATRHHKVLTMTTHRYIV